MIFVTLDGLIERKFSVDRSSSHFVESADVHFSAYEIDREMFLVRRNLGTSFYEFQKIKAGVQGYFAAYDCNTFPTIVKNKVDNRRRKVTETYFKYSDRLPEHQPTRRIRVHGPEERFPDHIQE